MTASSIQITQGSGTRLATDAYAEGGNIVHNEKIVLGEQNLASYVAVAAMSTATANSHLLQIMAGPSLRVRIRRIEYYLNSLATTAALGNVDIRRLTTAGSGGSTIAAPPLDPADVAAAASVMQLPTTKGTEAAAQLWSGTAYYMQTIGASTPLVQPILAVDFDRPRSRPLVIAAGTSNGIAIKQETAIAGAIARIVVWFDESEY